eukprot:766709-Hanusia_phi.AAC.1
MAGKKDKEQNRKDKKGSRDASKKKKDKTSDLCTQRQALKEFGLRIKVAFSFSHGLPISHCATKIVEGDGNCLFRALADQVSFAACLLVGMTFASSAAWR